MNVKPTSVTIVRISCGNVAINKKHKLHIKRDRDRDRDRDRETETERDRERVKDRQRETETETDRDRQRQRERESIYTYISNWIIEYIHIFIYNYIFCRVSLNLMLICIELPELIIYCKYA